MAVYRDRVYQNNDLQSEFLLVLEIAHTPSCGGTHPKESEYHNPTILYGNGKPRQKSNSRAARQNS